MATRIITVRRQAAPAPRRQAWLYSTAPAAVERMPWLRRGRPAEDAADETAQRRGWTPAATAGGYGGDQVPWLKREHGSAGEVDQADDRRRWSVVQTTGGNQVPWLHRVRPAEEAELAAAGRTWNPATGPTPVVVAIDSLPWLRRPRWSDLADAEPVARRAWPWLGTQVPPPVFTGGTPIFRSGTFASRTIGGAP